MGNVPFSCCRSKSPRMQQLSNKFRCKDRQGDNFCKSDINYDPTHVDSRPQSILQHISEREPDDLESDPSSNPFNKPMFAARSCQNPRTKRCAQPSISSQTSPSTSNEQNLQISGSHSQFQTCSQDDGYSSTPTYNLRNPHYGNHNNSFEQGSKNDSEQQASIVVNSRGYDSEAVAEEQDVFKVKKKLNNGILQNHPYHQRRYSEYFSKSVESEAKVIKSSSTSTIFIDSSTISQPSLDLTIKCVSLAIYYHMKNRSSDYGHEIFDETKHPFKMPSNQDLNEPYANELAEFTDDDFNQPSKKTIYNFVRTLFNSAQLTSEYAITTLVYLERLMTYAEMDLTPSTWRRMFLGAILLSSKVWEDQAVWNVDYAQILEDISVEDINELERQFLELIQFNMNVSSSIYAKYYFHLRSLAFENCLTEAKELLTIGRAKNLEAMSRVVIIDPQASPVQRKFTPNIKRHTSLEKLRLNGHTRAVLM